MKRGFLNKTYASGSTLATSASAVGVGSKVNGASPSAADVPSGQEATSALRRKLDDWATEDDRTKPRKKQPDRETTVAELLRRMQSVNGQAVISHFIVDANTKIFFLAIDQTSKARLSAQILAPLSAVPRVNLLTERPSPYLTGGKIAVARSAARPGDVLLREFPLLCLPNYYFAAPQPNGQPTNFESLIGVMLRSYSPAAEALYRSLHNAWEGYDGPFDHRGNGVLTGIYNTNCYFLDGLPSDDKIEYSGIFPTFSRVSHSCCPNAVAKWDSRTMTLEVRAARHIKPLEEVTVTYVLDLLWPTAQRQEFLRDGYHFECTCPACGDPAVSDARRAEIKAAAPPRRRDFVDWATNTRRATDTEYGDEFLLERSMRICELYEREQLVDDHRDRGGWTHAVAVMSCYLALGKEREAAFWARKVQTWMSVTGQEEPPELAAALRDVRSSPMWDLRQKFANAAPS